MPPFLVYEGMAAFLYYQPEMQEIVMINTPTTDQLNKIPPLYETEHVPPEKKLIHLHFFADQCHWWVIEWDRRDTFFGFVSLNGFQGPAEFGYFTLSELVKLKIYGKLEVLNDPFWLPQPVNDVWLIRRILQGQQSNSM